MSGHTPGPWVTGNTDPLLFGKQRGNGTEPIGFVYGPSFPERSEVGLTALANARLIAAAPDLLAAAQTAQLALADLISSNDPKVYAAALRQLDDAITKATGG